MKKIIAILLSLAVLAGLAACGASKQSEENAPAAFKAGVWAVIEDGKETGKTYTFTDSMKECAYDNGVTGIGFDYEIQGEDYVFHMGAVDDNTLANVIFTDDENCTVAWADRGVTETLKYIGQAKADEDSTDAPAVERRMIINNEPYVITADDGFNNAGVTELICDATETYSFTSSHDDTEWSVYVLDKKFEDGARYLTQAEKADLKGDGNLKIDEGKYIYIVCSESSFTAEKASGASLSINYASSISGNYQDSHSQRAYAHVIDNTETVEITISWSSSATERTVWEMICTKDGNKLNYTDCKKSDFTSDENGEGEPEVEYENGKGYFTVKDGKLLWDGADDEECRSCVFEK